MDMLVGKQWRCISYSYWANTSSREMYKKIDYFHSTYFTETKMVKPFFQETDGGYICKVVSWDYKLSDSLDWDFNYKEQAKKKQNGKYLTLCDYFNGSKRTSSSEIVYLSDKRFVELLYDSNGKSDGSHTYVND